MYSNRVRAPLHVSATFGTVQLVEQDVALDVAASAIFTLLESRFPKKDSHRALAGDAWDVSGLGSA